MTKAEIKQLQHTAEQWRLAAERAHKSIEDLKTANGRVWEDKCAAETRRERMSQFLRDEANRARAYGNPRLSEVFEAASRM